MKNLFSIVLIIGIGAIFHSSCKSTKQTTTANSNAKQTTAQTHTAPVLLASIQRTACFGQCPMYKTTFMDNGEVIYIGIRFVEKIGTYTALLDLEEINLIKTKAKEYGYFELDSLYPTSISDFPTVITEVNIDGKKKRVVNKRNPPAALKSFEQFLDGLLEAKELEKISDSTVYDNSQ